MATVRIENRAQLIYLLSEAAELEHQVLCSYLFAYFTLKEDAREGLSEEQLSMVNRWRSTIREITEQEMLHLACACNLLTAVGGAPQLRRSNLPSSPRAYPHAFKLRLMPFSLDAVEQFIFLERPESLADADDESISYIDSSSSFPGLSDIFSSERQYETLGQLYRGIEDGLRYLSHKFGEEHLFVGPVESQIDDRYFPLEGLRPVRDLDSALAALQTIIEQGEGASLETEDSHYKKFLRIHDEYESMKSIDPGFEPGRAVLANPYTLLPPDLAESSDVNLVDDPLTADVSNLFDGCYELMVQMLGRLFVHAEESETELKTIAATTIGLMIQVIDPLGKALTQLPGGPLHPGLNAGPSFRLSRGASIPTHKEAAQLVFAERLRELAAYCHFIQIQEGAPPAIAQIKNSLSRYASLFTKR